MKSDTNIDRLAKRHIVLLGIGHTNAHVLRNWKMQPLPDTDLTCISDRSIATYSGMLPAVLAGQLPPSAMEIDLVRLCSSAGARLIVDEVAGLDLPRQLVRFDSRPAVPFDALSIGIGSVPTVSGVQISQHGPLLKIKPMQTFLERLRSRLQKIEDANPPADRETPLRVVIAGSGAAGVEIAFCLSSLLKARANHRFSIELITRSDEILSGVIPSFRRRVQEELRRQNIAVRTGHVVVGVSDDEVLLNNGLGIPADLVIWATGASPPALLSKLNLPLDGRGFLATDATLRSTSRRPIFAVGDSGSMTDQPTPKAGVFAVRQGPVLWNNIKALLAGNDLEVYRPQESFLKLLNTGNGSAIGEWHGISFSGHWVKRVKDRIDGRFMQMYQVTDQRENALQRMPCKGCGCKLGADVLEAALTSTNGSSSPLAADDLDDAAIVQTSGGSIVASTDFFTSPFEDAWLTGRIIALHSASDLIAMGANVRAALANVVVPEGEATDQRRALSDLLEGSRLEFAAMGGQIVGGHTITGPRWEVGFTVIGDPPASGPLLKKKNLESGDQLFITKPLGVGVLLAAHMQSQCQAADYETMISTMLQRQHTLTSIVTELDISAGTDITGFGLAGHLIEMLSASHTAATIDLSALLLLPGTAAAINQGIESTLAPNNRNVADKISVNSAQANSPEFKVLFDPQTCGGLLLGVPAKAAAEFERRLLDAGAGCCVRIGEVCPDVDRTSPLQIV